MQRMGLCEPMQTWRVICPGSRLGLFFGDMIANTISLRTMNGVLETNDEENIYILGFVFFYE